MESTIEKYLIRPSEEVIESSTARTVIYSDVEGGKKVPHIFNQELYGDPKNYSNTVEKKKELTIHEME